MFSHQERERRGEEEKEKKESGLCCVSLEKKYEGVFFLGEREGLGWPGGTALSFYKKNKKKSQKSKKKSQKITKKKKSGGGSRT